MIILKNVSCKYDNNVNMLNNINIDIGQGNYALIGEDRYGAKKMFLRLISRLEKCDVGDIFIDYKNIKTIDFSKDISMGYVKEKTFFENKTVYQNLEYVYNIRGVFEGYNEKIDKVLENFEIQNLKNIKVKNLTHYQKILLSLCRLSLRNLDYLIIEEDIFSEMEQKYKEYIAEKIKNILNINSEITFICNTDDKFIIEILNLHKIIYDNGVIMVSEPDQ